jgi:hypothetical protein
MRIDTARVVKPECLEVAALTSACLVQRVVKEEEG